ncbi:MAG: hypothetical protein K0S55_476, partial [Clostridia bacterium]|nr:hypothetical protein [Clostridia bacterium]
RALPVVEAAVASGLLELYFEYKARAINNNNKNNQNGANDL